MMSKKFNVKNTASSMFEHEAASETSVSKQD